MDIKPTKHLLVRDWKENVVNAVVYPRAACCPNLSPFSLKLETFLRQHDVPHRMVSNEFKHGSSKAMVPFIELNGRSYPDSNHIMEVLIKEFNLNCDNSLTTKQRADAKAYTVLLEEEFFKAIMFMRAQSPAWMFGDEQGGGRSLPSGIKKILFQKFGAPIFKKRLMSRLWTHGIARNSMDEVEEIMKKDLGALSTLLGDQSYFFGDKPTSFDATAFAHIAMLLGCPQPTENVTKFVEASTPNLKAFFERMKAAVWPDWEELGKTLALNPNDVETTTPAEGTDAASPTPAASSPPPAGATTA